MQNTRFRRFLCHRSAPVEPAPEDRREEDRDAIERWARAEGVDLENEAQRAREKLRNVYRARE